MRFYFSVIFIFGFILSSQAQTIKGKITNKNGEPLAYASVSVKNTSTGTSTNFKGNYSLELIPGKYTLVYSYIGYQNLEKNIVIRSNKSLTINVILESKSTQLNEIEIVGNPKDRAKEILKNVREKRKFYLNQIESYECKTSLKISLEREIVKIKESDTIPEEESKKTKKWRKKKALEKQKLDSLQQDSSKIEKNPQAKKPIKLRENIDLLESISKSYFQKPNQFKEVITAYKDHTERKSAWIYGAGVSIETNIGSDGIAPVRYQAENPYLLYEDNLSCDFNFYKNLIHYPKIASKPLLSPIASNSALSYTYFYEGTIHESGKKIYRIKVKPIFKSEALFFGYIFIEDSTWAIHSLDLSINKSALLYCNIFNIKQDYEAISSNQYLPVKKDIYYTIKDGRNEVRGNISVVHSDYKINIPFEKKFFTDEVKRFEDDAFDKDSIFWEEENVFEFNEQELEFIDERDSINNYYLSDLYLDRMDSLFNQIDIWTPLNGIGRRDHRKGTQWHIGGILEQIVPLGVGGYRHRLPFTIRKRFKNAKVVEIDAAPDYGFKNQDLKGRVGLGFTFFPKKFFRTFVYFGEYYSMINNFASIQATFSRSNYVLNREIQVAQRMEIINGLYGDLTFEFSNQRPITNIKLANWSGDLFGDLNTPVEFDPYVKSEIKLELQYRIKQKYVIKQGRKIIIGTDFPELRLTYRKGIPNLFGSEVNFDFLELGTRGDFKLARFGLSSWEVKMGSFLNKKSLRVLEYKFFRGSDRYFFSSPLRSFQLLGPTLNTPNEFFRVNYVHHFEGSLLNKVPLLNKLKIYAMGGAGTLLIPDNDFAHFEMFAGIERTFRIKKQLFRIAVLAVTADNTVSKADITYKFGISFYNSFSQKWEY